MRLFASRAEDGNKTKKQLMEEMAELRQRMAEWEVSEPGRERPEEQINRKNAVLDAINPVFRERINGETEAALASNRSGRG